MKTFKLTFENSSNVVIACVRADTPEKALYKAMFKMLKAGCYDKQETYACTEIKETLQTYQNVEWVESIQTDCSAVSIAA